MKLWEKLSIVPKWAKKEIKSGTLKGKTDISPMWRIEVMTENFGICGIGWKYEIVRQWTEKGVDESIMCFTNINLFIKNETEWSDPIPGTGGSMIINKFSSGLKNSDEGYKMSLTDALSVGMKSLGVGASVYSGSSDDSKYTRYIEGKLEAQQ